VKNNGSCWRWESGATVTEPKTPNPRLLLGGPKGTSTWSKKTIIAPASALAGTRLEIRESGMVVPGAHLVIAKALAVAGQAVDLVTGLADHEERSVQ
jgi:hypothetical protein